MSCQAFSPLSGLQISGEQPMKLFAIPFFRPLSGAAMPLVSNTPKLSTKYCKDG
jgi:hypothetical protein